VNFLLHRHLAARDLGSTLAGIGAMLPDLWRMADRRVRASAAAVGDGGSDELVALLRGVRHHLEADAWFHDDPVFLDGERGVTERLRAARLAARHASLFAHVLWELCLDGALVRREGEVRVRESIREGVDGGGEAIEAVAQSHHFCRVDHTPAARRRFEERIRRMLHALASEPWVAGYATGAGLAERISAIRQRLGLDPLDRNDHARLEGVATEALALAEGALDGVLARGTVR